MFIMHPVWCGVFLIQRSVALRKKQSISHNLLGQRSFSRIAILYTWPNTASWARHIRYLTKIVDNHCRIFPHKILYRECTHLYGFRHKQGKTTLFKALKLGQWPSFVKEWKFLNYSEIGRHCYLEYCKMSFFTSKWFLKN